MIKSKFSILTWPFIFVLAMLSLYMSYTVCRVVIDNVSSLTDFVVVVEIVVLVLTVLFLLMMLRRHTREFVIHENRLEIKYFFGLSSESYSFEHLKFSYYSWTTNVALLELPNGKQLTLARSYYLNYDFIVEALRMRIKNEKLKFKFVNRLTIFIVVAIVLIYLMIVQLGKG